MKVQTTYNFNTVQPMGPNENKIAGNMNSMKHSYRQINGAGLNIAWVRSNRNKMATSPGGQKEKRNGTAIQ